MVCEACGTEFISGGDVRHCDCTCGQRHHVCASCRLSLSDDDRKMGEYDRGCAGGFRLLVCPLALRVALILIGESGE